MYYDFIWGSHEKYEGFLTIQLSHCDKPRYMFAEEGAIAKNLFESEREDPKYIERFVDVNDRREAMEI